MKTFATLETVERRQILRVIRATKGNLSKAAQVLGIDRRTLYRKLEKYNQSRRTAFTIDYVSAYPANLTGGAGSTAIELLAKSYANELTET